MEVIHYKKEIFTALNILHKQGKRIGFVPTMGALHEGHLSLIRRCRKENDISAASIFVNPTQFNDKNDLKKYPRRLDQDMKMLQNEKCDFLFCPDEKEMYPEPDNRIFNFGDIENTMEGIHRPGHFNGVAQIVSKLFDAILPDNAYFGEKDFQQLVIMRQLVNILKLPVKIVPCPIVREPDGLAMSSRNLLLGVEERINAPIIYQTLNKTKELKASMSVAELKKWVIQQINKNPYLKVDYFEIVDDFYLKPVINWNDKNNKIGCIAVKAGNIRLIDNIRL